MEEPREIKQTSEGPKENENLFPTENILGINEDKDRFTTSFWLDRSIVNDFKEACHLSGRKTCDVIEPLMEAFVKITKNKLLNKVDVCPFKAVNVTIGTLNISQKYDKRGPKEKIGIKLRKEDFRELCPFGGGLPVPKLSDRGLFSCYTCRHGGKKHLYPKLEPCSVYLRK